MKYEVKFTKSFKKSFKKYQHKSDDILLCIEKLANDEKLERKYKDHALKGEYNGCRECHILPDLLLIYKKDNDILVLVCLELGSHSELF